jgi:hypothetical protein
VKHIIEQANAILASETAADGNDDPRWQAVIDVGAYVETDPDAVWQFVRRWGSDSREELRDAIAGCLLEHLLEHHFLPIFPRVERAVWEDRRFADTFCRCWKFGLSETRKNAEAFDGLQAQCRAMLE